jgi:histidine triad (HIT) family protein
MEPMVRFSTRFEVDAPGDTGASTSNQGEGDAGSLRQVDCLFCSIADGSVPSHRVLEEELVVGFLDARPVFKGHVLVVPRSHVVTLPELATDLLEPFFGAVQRVAAAVVQGLGAQGSFVAVNNVVSQSVPHLHCHVVPRTKGDGLRGFFWPRTKYASDEEAGEYAARLSGALARR